MAKSLQKKWKFELELHNFSVRYPYFPFFGRDFAISNSFTAEPSKKHPVFERVSVSLWGIKLWSLFSRCWASPPMPDVLFLMPTACKGFRVLVGFGRSGPIVSDAQVENMRRHLGKLLKTWRRVNHQVQRYPCHQIENQQSHLRVSTCI